MSNEETLVTILNRWKNDVDDEYGKNKYLGKNKKEILEILAAHLVAANATEEEMKSTRVREFVKRSMTTKDKKWKYPNWDRDVDGTYLGVIARYFEPEKLNEEPTKRSKEEDVNAIMGSTRSPKTIQKPNQMFDPKTLYKQGKMTSTREDWIAENLPPEGPGSWDPDDLIDIWFAGTHPFKHEGLNRACHIRGSRDHQVFLYEVYENPNELPDGVLDHLKTKTA